MNIDDFPVLRGNGEVQVSTLLFISDKRLEELNRIVPTTMVENWQLGVAKTIQCLWVKAVTVHEFAFMCEQLGQIEAQLFSHVGHDFVPDEFKEWVFF